VLAVVEEIPGADPDFQPEPIVRYLYDPYGVPAAYTDPNEVPDPATAEYDSLVAAGSTIGGRFPGGQNLLFQGLWTDPVTGISYARARLYDSHNVSWLSEDPSGYIDSVNLYQPFGLFPALNIDPLGNTVLVVWYGRGSRYGDGDFDVFIEKLLMKKEEGLEQRIFEIEDGVEKTYEHYRSPGYSGSINDLKTYVMTCDSNSTAIAFKGIMKEFNENVESGEDVFLVGHSRGVARISSLAKKLKEEDIEIEGFVAVDLVENVFGTADNIPDNVNYFIAYYSDPSKETKEKREKEGAPHMPCSGEREYTLSDDTINLGIYAVDETHQSIDGSDRIHEDIISLIEGDRSRETYDPWYEQMYLYHLSITSPLSQRDDDNDDDGTTRGSD
jgi:RHS repeat-associated protein